MLVNFYYNDICYGLNMKCPPQVHVFNTGFSGDGTVLRDCGNHGGRTYLEVVGCWWWRLNWIPSALLFCILAAMMQTDQCHHYVCINASKTEYD
jgi:hypothetical protein